MPATTTPNLNLPYLDASQSQPEVKINEAWDLLDAADGGTGLAIQDSDSPAHTAAAVKTIRFANAEVTPESDGSVLVTVDTSVGPRGSLWYHGAAAPGTITGQLNGDLYLNTTTNDLYQLTAGAWAVIDNIKGVPGNPGTGTGGARGSLFYVAAGAPATITGQANNDLYLNSTTSDLYQLQSGAWVVVANTKGTPGADASTSARTTVSVTSSSNAQVTGNVTLAKGFRLLRVACAQAARFRLYATVAERNADVARPYTTYPSAASGLIGEWNFDGATVTSIDCAPVVNGANMEATPVSTIAYTLDPPASGATTVNLLYQGVET